MTSEELDLDLPISPEQRALLDGFDREASEVFSELGAALPGDADLVARFADAAITSAPALAGGEAVGGGAAGSKLVAGLGLAALAGVVVAAIWFGTRPDAPTAAPARPSAQAQAPEPAFEPTPGVAAVDSNESEPLKLPEPAEPETEIERPAGRRSEARPSTPAPQPEPSPEPALSARDLLKAANASRRIGDFTKAATGYERLAREFAGTREDMIARVSLGKLQLERLGEPAQALRNFDVYLAKSASGNLAEEALYGRARALRRLGRGPEEREAWAELLRRFPNSVHAEPTGRAQAGAGD